MGDPITISAILSAVGAGLGAVFGFVTALVGEAWARYFFILAGLTALSSIEGIFSFVAGVEPLSSIISFVVANVFGIQGFTIHIWQLTILAAFMPIILFMLKLVRGYNK